LSGWGRIVQRTIGSCRKGELVELIQGRFIESSTPLPHHQFVVALLAASFVKVARGSGGVALIGPIDVVLSDHSILQPDIVYISKQRRNIIKQRITGAPDFVVEVLSKGTSRRDRIEKLELYARYGVSEYWIVDPQAQLFEFLVNDNGRFVVHSPLNDRYQSPCLPEVAIQVADFWREVSERWPAENE
jgi:Uma2 family endonuclease